MLQDEHGQHGRRLPVPEAAVPVERGGRHGPRRPAGDPAEEDGARGTEPGQEPEQRTGHEVEDDVDGQETAGRNCGRRGPPTGGGMVEPDAEEQHDDGDPGRRPGDRPVGPEGVERAHGRHDEADQQRHREGVEAVAHGQAGADPDGDQYGAETEERAGVEAAGGEHLGHRSEH